MIICGILYSCVSALMTFFCCSPQVRPLGSSGKLNDALKERVNSVFFLYIGPTESGQRVFVGHYNLCVFLCFISKDHA